jgi:hypothetical protein
MCKHLNGELSTYATTENIKHVENGGIHTIGDNNIGNITHYIYRCFDCRKHFVFNGVPKQKWLQQIYFQIDG